MKALIRGLGIGLKSIQLNWLPALILQMMMVGLGLCYQAQFTWALSIFKLLSEAKKWGGIYFSFIVGALAAGVLSEVFRVYFVDAGRWRREHLVDMLFKVFLMGGVSVMTDYFYRFQTDWFGSGSDWNTLNKKVLVDVFIYSYLLTVPLNCTLFLWKEQGFDWGKTVRQMTPFSLFFTQRLLPLGISNLCFWVPIVYVIYSMPPLLQMPFNLIAATIWGILIVTISNESGRQ